MNSSRLPVVLLPVNVVLLTLPLAMLALSCGAPERSGGGAADAAEAGEGEGGVGGVGGAVSSNFTPETYCAAVTQAACELAVKCDNETLFEDRNGGDLAACKETLMAECTALILPFERGVAAEAIEYTGAELQACLNTVREAECTDAAAAWGLLSCERGGARQCDRWYFRTALDDRCKAVFAGAVDDGGACYSDAECGYGLYCNLARCRDDRSGACEPRLRRGDLCAFTPLGCDEGLICSGTTNIKKCKPLAVQGEECSLDSPAGGGVSKPNCLPPLQCISGSGGEQGGGTGGSFGICQPLSKRTDPCGQGRAKCEPDSYCDFKSTGSIQGHCEAFKAEEAECKDDADPRQCGAGLYCFSTETVPGVVPPRVRPDGRCEKYQPLEGLCVKNHSNCLQGWCTADAHTVRGFCEPFKEARQDCSAGYQCGPGSHCVADSATGTKICAPLGDEEQYVCLRPAQ